MHECILFNEHAPCEIGITVVHDVLMQITCCL